MSETVATIHSVNLLSQDVQESDLHRLIVRSLRELQTATDGVFTRIRQQAHVQRDRLTQIRHRINVANAKITHLVGSKEAIVVHSSSDYPIASGLKKDRNIFGLSIAPSNDETETMDALPAYGASNGPDSLVDMGGRSKKVDNFDIDSLRGRSGEDLMLSSEKQQTLDTLWSEIHQDGQLNSSDTDVTGIGTLPPDVSSCASMLLFNTGENPYKEYKTMDNLVHGSQIRRAEEATEKSALARAPQSLMDTDAALPAVAGIELEYKPSVKEITKFDLPSDLALPNVVDIAWDAYDDTQESALLVPTAYQANLPVLPSVSDYLPDVGSKHHTSSPAIMDKAASTSAVTSSAQQSTIPAPAPPAPAPTAPTVNSHPAPPQPPAHVVPPTAPTSQMQPTGNQVSSVHPPEALHTTPDQAESISSTLPSTAEKNTAPTPSISHGRSKSELPMPTGGRLNLMSALRGINAKQKLKPVSQKKAAAPKPAKSGGGGGMFDRDEFKAKLAARRSAIAGETPVAHKAAPSLAGRKSRTTPPNPSGGMLSRFNPRNIHGFEEMDEDDSDGSGWDSD